jgi:hypothetical protein
MDKLKDDQKIYFESAQETDDAVHRSIVKIENNKTDLYDDMANCIRDFSNFISYAIDLGYLSTFDNKSMFIEYKEKSLEYAQKVMNCTSTRDEECLKDMQDFCAKWIEHYESIWG